MIALYQLSKFQQELLDAADKIELCCISHGFNSAMGRQPYAQREAEEYEQAKAAFRTLLLRAVDKDGPLVKQTIDSIYLKALELACAGFEDTIENQELHYRLPEYWIEQAEKAGALSPIDLIILCPTCNKTWKAMGTHPDPGNKECFECAIRKHNE